jgi:hypothetical protein
MKLKRKLKQSDHGDDVRILQQRLKELNLFNERIDGYYGQNTMMAVIKFQKKIGIAIDGVVGLQTWSQLVSYNEGKQNKSDNLIQLLNESGLIIYSGADNRSERMTIKNTIFIFINNSSSRPDLTLDKVSAHYVIGRKSSSNDNKYWDGKILKSMDDKYYISRFEDQLINERSIFIEICNYGELHYKNGNYYNLVNKPILNSDDVINIDDKYYEKITDQQIESLINLIRYLKQKWNIEIIRYFDENWFKYDENWFSLGGLRTLGQVIKDKSDLFPQKNLIESLNRI